MTTSDSRFRRYHAVALEQLLETAAWAEVSREDMVRGLNGYAPSTLEYLSAVLETFLANVWTVAREYDPGQVGHDLWLTVNHHGAGFWDGDYPAGHEATLMTAAREIPEIGLHVGDDGLVYH